MMRKFGFLAAVFIFAIVLFCQGLAQTTFERTYGGSQTDYAVSIVEIDGGAFVVAGCTNSYGTGGDVYMIKINASGDIVWEQNHGGDTEDNGYSLVSTADGGFVIGGYTSSSGGDAYILKTNSLGEFLWDNTFGGSEYDEADYIYLNDDGGFAMAGYTSSFGSVGNDGYIIRTDSSGDSIWADNYSYLTSEVNERFYAISETSDGGFIAAGLYMSWPTQSYLVKLDGDGGVEWEQIYSDFNRTNHIIETAPGEYTLTGVELDENSYVALVELNSSGNIVNQWRYGVEIQQYGYHVDQTDDGGYIIAGQVIDGTDYDVILIKTDSAGNETWKKYYGGTFTDMAYCVKSTSDGGYIMCGYSEVTGPGTEQVYIIKTDSEGNVNGSGINDGNENNHPDLFTLSQNYPNPFNSETVISYSLSMSASVKLEIFDILGRSIETLIDATQKSGYYDVIWKADSYSSGIYFYKISVNNKTFTKRLILLK